MNDKDAQAVSPEDVCQKCGSSMSEITETKAGKKLQRCSAGSWNEEERRVEGCDYVRWIVPPPEELDEKCPKCGAALLLATTRFGKRLKKCSTNTWDPQTRTASGCDFVEWMKGETKKLDEDCPKCEEKLVLYTTAAGKKLKKCSTNAWDAQTGTATGCDFVEWQA